MPILRPAPGSAGGCRQISIRPNATECSADCERGHQATTSVRHQADQVREPEEGLQDGNRVARRGQRAKVRQVRERREVHHADSGGALGEEDRRVSGE